MRLCRDDSRFRNDYTQALLKFLKQDETSPVTQGVIKRTEWTGSTAKIVIDHSKKRHKMYQK